MNAVMAWTYSTAAFERISGMQTVLFHKRRECTQMELLKSFITCIDKCGVNDGLALNDLTLTSMSISWIEALDDIHNNGSLH